MRFPVSVILLVVLTTVWTQAKEHAITIVTNPPGASVYFMTPTESLERTLLGNSGEVVLIPSFVDSAQIVLELPDYLNRSLILKSEDLEEPQYPREGAIVLEPISRGFIRRHLGMIGLLSLTLVIGVPIYFYRERRLGNIQQLRKEALAQYQGRSRKDDPFIMKVVGGYRLVDLIGNEPDFRVYLGIDDKTLKPETLVSIKILKQEIADDDNQRVERFRREMELTKSFQNPKIVRNLDAGESNGSLYLVQEYFEGETLRQRICKGSFTLDEAVSFLTDVMDGLSYAHQRGVIHRDIKPDNLLITDSGIKLTNFGLARGVDSDSITKTSTSLGTPTYTAPEQISGETSKVTDGRCDQYSMGVIAYELLTGHPPFVNASISKLLLSHLYETPEPISTAVPRQIEESVFRMLAKSPEDRFPSINEASECLRRGLGASQTSGRLGLS